MEMRFAERTVTLCAGHARIARSLGVISLAELRAVFSENGGRRSFLQRRAQQRETASGRRSADARERTG
jgi:hypothetical protein